MNSVVVFHYEVFVWGNFNVYQAISKREQLHNDLSKNLHFYGALDVSNSLCANFYENLNLH